MMSSSLYVITAIGFSAVQFALGTLLGWWLRNRRAVPTQVEAAPSPSQEWASAALTQLRDLTTRVSEDVRQHTTQVEGISQGLKNAEGLSDEHRRDAITAAGDQIVTANARLQQQLADAEKKLREKEQELQEQAQTIEVHKAEARTDVLTGAANRRAFDDELASRVAEWNDRKTPVSLIMVDADHFKRFNDRFGHQAGDETLKRIASRLKLAMRDIDVVARYGGEEFAVILTGMALADAKRAAECVRAAIAEDKFDFQGTPLSVTVSVGLASAANGEQPAALIKRADAALYAAKQAGRNAAHVHDGKYIEKILPEPVVRAPRFMSLAEVKRMVDDANQPIAGRDETRDNQRREFSAIQAIARHTGDELPADTEFRQVKCLDLSSSGLSFLVPEPLEDQSLVIRFGADPNFMYVVGKVMNQAQVPSGAKPMYRIGCQFTNRAVKATGKAETSHVPVTAS